MRGSWGWNLGFFLGGMPNEGDVLLVHDMFISISDQSPGAVVPATAQVLSIMLIAQPKQMHLECWNALPLSSSAMRKSRPWVKSADLQLVRSSCPALGPQRVMNLLEVGPTWSNHSCRICGGSSGILTQPATRLRGTRLTSGISGGILYECYQTPPTVVHFKTEDS